MKIDASNLFWFGARILVGLVFAYAGLMKLLEPSANFEAAILQYGVFPPGWISWIARIVPWLEWLLGSLTVVGYAPRLTALGVSLLSLAFLVTLGSSGLLLESVPTDCGCFGNSGLHLSIRQVFFVDLFSLGAALGIISLKEFPGSLHSFLVKKSRAEDDTRAKR